MKTKGTTMVRNKSGGASAANAKMPKRALSMSKSSSAPKDPSVVRQGTGGTLRR